MALVCVNVEWSQFPNFSLRPNHESQPIVSLELVFDSRMTSIFHNCFWEYIHATIKQPKFGKSLKKIDEKGFLMGSQSPSKLASFLVLMMSSLSSSHPIPSPHMTRVNNCCEKNHTFGKNISGIWFVVIVNLNLLAPHKNNIFFTFITRWMKMTSVTSWFSKSSD